MYLVENMRFIACEGHALRKSWLQYSLANHEVLLYLSRVNLRGAIRPKLSVQPEASAQESP